MLCVIAGYCCPNKLVVLVNIVSDVLAMCWQCVENVRCIVAGAYQWGCSQDVGFDTVAGTCSPGQGLDASGQCADCNVDYFAKPGWALCHACPPHSSTAGALGATECSRLPRTIEYLENDNDFLYSGCWYNNEIIVRFSSPWPIRTPIWRIRLH